MAMTIFRGSTPTIRLRPTNGMNVADLGLPTVAIVQELTYLTPEVTVKTADNCIEVSLTQEDTFQLVPGVETRIQQVWMDSDGNVVRFPEHKLTVGSTLISTLDEPIREED